MAINKYHELLSQLRRIMPPHCVLAEEEEKRPFECDGLSLYKTLPAMVVLPENEGQVQAVMRLCKQYRVPLVPRGAGTGLSGGATPHENGVLIGLSKLNCIVRIDPRACIAVVQAGVRNLAISEAAAPYGLYYAPDPSSQIACSIGGNVAENAGGVHCIKYGLTLHNVLRVRMVNSDGDIVELGSEAPDSAGIDLLAAFVGSEGMLGIATEMTLKLVPKPELAVVVSASFNTIEDAGKAVADVVAQGIIPAGLELMDQKAIHMVEPFVNAGYDMNAQAVLLCESDGTSKDVADEIERIKTIFSRAGASQMLVSTSEAQRLRLWAGRKNAFPAAGRASPDYYCMDGTIPRRHLARVLNAIKEMETRFGLRCANVFHAGDGNLHPMILFDANNGDELGRAEDFGAAILELCVEVGGTITGEHGVGLEKINQMCSQFTRQELDVFDAVKCSFDPYRLLNPSKLIPTLNRCAEYGRVHVHAGNLRFPELPRF